VDDNLFNDAVLQGIDLGQEAAALSGQGKITEIKFRALDDVAVQLDVEDDIRERSEADIAIDHLNVKNRSVINALTETDQELARLGKLREACRLHGVPRASQNRTARAVIDGAGFKHYQPGANDATQRANASAAKLRSTILVA